MRMYTLCACLHVYTLYNVHVYTSKHTHSVYSCRLISTHLESNLSPWLYIDSVMQELLLGGARTKVCLGTKEAGIKLKLHAQPKFQYTSMATPFLVLTTGRTVMPLSINLATIAVDM